MVRIASVHLGPHGLEVSTSDGDRHGPFGWRWLRRHGVDSTSLDPATPERRIDAFAIPTELEAESVIEAVDGGSMEIFWNDGSPPSTITIELILAVVGPIESATERRTFRPDQRPPSRAYADVAGSQAGLLAWLTDVATYGFCTVRGFHRREYAADDLAGFVGPLMETVFGSAWTHSSVGASSVPAGPRMRSELRTEGAYALEVPGLQFLACIDREGAGGEIVLVDGYAIADELRTEHPAYFETLSTVDIPSRCVRPGEHHLEALRPAIRVDKGGAVDQVSFSIADRAPFWLDGSRMGAFDDAYDELHRRIVEPDRGISISLEPGEAILFDNWRMLHGRAPALGHQTFRGSFQSRDTYLSQMRVLKSLI